MTFLQGPHVKSIGLPGNEFNKLFIRETWPKNEDGFRLRKTAAVLWMPCSNGLVTWNNLYSVCVFWHPRVNNLLFLPYGSGKSPKMKWSSYWRDPFLTSMIMGGSVPLAKEDVLNGCTPPKTNMEPEKKSPWKRRNIYKSLILGVPCQFSGV